MNKIQIINHKIPRWNNYSLCKINANLRLRIKTNLQQIHLMITDLWTPFDISMFGSCLVKALTCNTISDHYKENNEKYKNKLL